MKEVWASFRLAFSMYSIFPARQIKKTRSRRDYRVHSKTVAGDQPVSDR